ncbi:hypothetical protein CHS0354_010829 [Potamilus streckersoni]|uniref:Delta-like protein n=1 Tax=Potamilus streckersoni TaxID=2493646 RepID=A0AAE0T992_9BIVA|nr:hypothetical protein CHS0354_010829 [Potamilus streckersoni]
MQISVEKTLNTYLPTYLTTNGIIVRQTWYLLCPVFGSGIVAVTLYEFRNPRALTYDMTCCDGFQIPGCPSDSCDHHFEICLTDLRNYNCTHGPKGITAKDNQNTATFEGAEGRTLFKFNTWPGSMQVFISVTDVDSDGSQLVDTFAYNYSTINVGYNGKESTTVKLEISGNRPIAATRLYMGISVYCDQHYYGKDCSIKCIGQSGCEGHYTCDQNGNKSCSSGWTGENCTEQIPGAGADCSVYQGQNEFVPSKWVGTYHCPSQPNASTVLNVTKSETRIEVVGDFLFNGNTYPMKGTYASTVDFLTVQTSRQDFIGNLSSIELDLTVHQHLLMKGSMIVTGETTQTCEITLTRTQVFFGGCNFQGTCIRFGQNKEQYYCCCKEGYSGNNCETSVKEYITTSMQEPQSATRLSSTANLKTTPKTNPSTAKSVSSTGMFTAPSLVITTTKISTTYQTVPLTSSTLSSTTRLPRTSLSTSASTAPAAATNSTSTSIKSTTLKPKDSTITAANSSRTTNPPSTESTISTTQTSTNAQTTSTIASTGNSITTTTSTTPRTSTIISSKSAAVSSTTLQSTSITRSSPSTFTTTQNALTSTTMAYPNPTNLSYTTGSFAVHSTVKSSSKLATTQLSNNHTLAPYFLPNSSSKITAKPTQLPRTKSMTQSTGLSNEVITANSTKMATAKPSEQPSNRPTDSKDRPKYSLYRILLIEVLGQE